MACDVGLPLLSWISPAFRRGPSAPNLILIISYSDIFAR
ncbi:hypothetical protein [Azospirillum endophyticum]